LGTTWARGYLALSSGNITDELVKEYVEEQDGEQIIMIVDFQSTAFKFPWLPAESCSISSDDMKRKVELVAKVARNLWG